MHPGERGLPTPGYPAGLLAPAPIPRGTNTMAIAGLVLGYLSPAATIAVVVFFAALVTSY